MAADPGAEAWYERYATRSETTRRPLTAAERDTLAARIGAAGHTLLAAVYLSLL